MRGESRMRPQSALLENVNSYDIISDEEELQEITYDIDCSKNLQSLYSHQKKEKDARPRFPFTSAADGIQRGFCSSLENENQQQACEWPAILEEANELAGLDQKAYNSFNSSIVPDERRFHKGGRGSSGFRFSFRSLPNKDGFSRAFLSSKNEIYNLFEEDIEVVGEQDCFEHRADEDTEPQLLGNILEENAELDSKPAFRKQLVGTASVSELLEDMHKANPSSRRSLVEDNTKGKEKQKSSSKKTLLYLGDRVLGNKDTPDFIGEISSEDEYIDQDHQISQIVKGQTMTDIFQEAFNTFTEDAAEIPRSIELGIHESASLPSLKLLPAFRWFGYHGRLQKVMQHEKDRCMAHLKHLETGQTTSNESNCIDARILSRTLEAKLTVCQCLIGEYNNSLGYEKISQNNCEKTYLEGFEDEKTMKRTVIFSPKFCGHVELEVGNIVCIRPPWKEVQVNGGETIILCSYFSPMKAQRTCDKWRESKINGS